MEQRPWGASIDEEGPRVKDEVMTALSKDRLAPVGRESYPAIVCSYSYCALAPEIG